MTRAKGKAAVKKTRDERPSAKSEESRSAPTNVPSVHVISGKDLKSHFGPSAGTQKLIPTDKPETSVDADADPETADVRLTLGRSILRNAEAAASKQGIELSRYVELALKNYRRE